MKLMESCMTRLLLDIGNGCNINEGSSPLNPTALPMDLYRYVCFKKLK